MDTWWHAEATRYAMETAGFSNDARLAVQVSNYLTDFLSVVSSEVESLNNVLPDLPALKMKREQSFDYLHFDYLTTSQQIEQQWNQLEKNTQTALRKYKSASSVKAGFRMIVLFNILGASLHAIQDFYSHSNWVNLHVAQTRGPVPLWFDVLPAQRLKMSLRTGVYPDSKPPKPTDHAALNKDSSQRPLHAEAFDVSKRASADWLKRLMKDSGIPWRSLKSYNIQNTLVMRHFLYDLDATFVTSTSILAGHFDGKRPVKKVFNSDSQKEKAQAKQAALLVLTGYSGNILLKENTYRLPSPYWGGFHVYHINRDLASGLKYGKKTFSDSA